MKFSATRQSTAAINTPCLVVGIFKDAVPAGAGADIDQATGGLLERLRRRGDVGAKAGAARMLFDVDGIKADRILLVGCGKQEAFDARKYLRVCRAAAKALTQTPSETAVTALAQLPVIDRESRWCVEHAVLETAYGAYRYTATQSKPAKAGHGTRLKAVKVLGPQGTGRIVASAAAVAAGVDTARELGNLPPNICTPTYLRDTARKLGRKYDRVAVSVKDRKALEKEGFGALLAVAQGSSTPPFLITMRYTGDAKSKKPYVLVGKGITFDTGGISLKPGAGMDEMKFDMCGAASVFGVITACAELELKANVVGIVPAVENMPGGKAYRPADIVTSLSGQTIEVLNTDAEGRMILCDALTHAGRTYKPQALIDIATLTGACVVALGHHASGLMTPHDDLADELLAAGETSGDRAWRLPLWDDYQKQIDSIYADMANVGGKGAGAVTAACFLSRYAEDQRWAHLDIAGTAWENARKEGATGRPVTMLMQYLRDRS